MAIQTSIDQYGTQMPRTASFLNKRKGDKRYGFAFPMGDIDSGQFLKKASDTELIRNQLRQLLLTSRGERVMLPAYGTNLRRYLMEPLDQATLSQIKREILESFSRYAPNVSLAKIQVFPGATAAPGGGHFLIVRLFCVLKAEQDVLFEIKVDIR
jgi:phage baseplate assembly protein W